MANMIRDAGILTRASDIGNRGRMYRVLAGCHEFTFWSLSDTRAALIMRKWVALFWRRYKARLSRECPGSIAAATAEGWYNTPPRAELYRHHKGSGAWIAGAGAVKLTAHGFEIDDEITRLPGFAGRPV